MPWDPVIVATVARAGDSGINSHKIRLQHKYQQSKDQVNEERTAENEDIKVATETDRINNNNLG